MDEVSNCLNWMTENGYILMIFGSDEGWGVTIIRNDDDVYTGELGAFTDVIHDAYLWAREDYKKS